MNKKRRLLQLFIMVLLICSVGLNIISFKKNHLLSTRYEGLMCVTMELQEASLISFVTTNVSEYENTKVEIFSVEKGEVIKSLEVSPEIRQEVKNIIKDITGLYSRLRALPSKGYIIRVPLEPPEEINNYWINDFGITSINQVFILFPDNEKPYLLVLDKNGRPIFYNFNTEVEQLLEHLDLQIN